MSKIEAGKTTLDLTTVNLPQLLDDLKDMLQIRADDKDLQLDFSYSMEIPRFIRVDAVKLKQILLNLLSNALKYTQQGQVSFYAKALRSQTVDQETAIPESGLAKEDKQVGLQFAIADTGPGIPVESQDTIFQPFVQSSANQHTIQGTGLGLPISRKFAQMMGGNIRVDSRLGQGSTFYCDILVSVLDSSQTLVEPTSQKNYDGIEGIKNPQISYRFLIVDDSLDNRKLLSQILSLKGIEIDIAANGLEAVQKNHSWQPHLIWMDIRMPVMDGLTAVRNIRQSQHQPIIIATTANAFEDSQEAALAAGCNDFISKPFSTDQIFDCIERLLKVEFTETQKHSPQANRPKPKPKSDEVVIREGFKAMPEAWQLAFRQSIRALNNKRIASLLAEVPQEHHAMTKAIKTLQNNYRFDILVEILMD